MAALASGLLLHNDACLWGTRDQGTQKWNQTSKYCLVFIEVELSKFPMTVVTIDTRNVTFITTRLWIEQGL